MKKLFALVVAFGVASAVVGCEKTPAGATTKTTAVSTEKKM